MVSPELCSGVTDPYQPVERQLRLTRRCLEVLAEFRQAVAIVTKNRLVTRDLDLLGELAHHQAAGVMLSITTLDAEFAGQLEPRTSRPAAKLEAIRTLTKAGIPTGVMIARVIRDSPSTRCPQSSKPPRGPGPRTPAMCCSGCRWPWQDFSRSGSTVIGRPPRRRSWGGSGPRATAGSTTLASVSGCG